MKLLFAQEKMIDSEKHKVWKTKMA